jgi:FkbM family methyltransferase
MRQVWVEAANKLYDHCYPLYEPLYSIWKSFADRRERRLLRDLIKPGMTVVDVGANIGAYTRFLAGLTGASGGVHAFEPSPRNFKRLQNAVARFPNVAVNQAAVGERSGTVGLYLSPELNVDHRTFDCGDGRRVVDVPLLSLDDYFPPGSAVAFIKVDVQGFEHSVLRGAQRVLTENRDIRVLMEFWPYGLSKAGGTASEVLEFIAAGGLEIRAVCGAGGLPFDPESLDPGNLEHYCNLLLGRKTAEV